MPEFLNYPCVGDRSVSIQCEKGHRINVWLYQNSKKEDLDGRDEGVVLEKTGTDDDRGVGMFIKKDGFVFSNAIVCCCETCKEAEVKKAAEGKRDPLLEAYEREEVVGLRLDTLGFELMKIAIREVLTETSQKSEESETQEAVQDTPIPPVSQTEQAPQKSKTIEKVKEMAHKAVEKGKKLEERGKSWWASRKTRQRKGENW